MKVRFPLFFWLVLILFLLHQIIQKLLELHLLWIDDYFDPFACAMLALFVAQRHFSILQRDSAFQLAVWQVLVTVTVLAIISEELFPVLSVRFTKDYWDYLAFAVGGFLFYISQKRCPVEKIHEFSPP